jgi:hypothetical protein
MYLFANITGQRFIHREQTVNYFRVDRRELTLSKDFSPTSGKPVLVHCPVGPWPHHYAWPAWSLGCEAHFCSACHCLWTAVPARQ